MCYEWTIYSLKVGACLAVFYLFFKLLLSRETFHRFNRIVVLGAMLLSFVLPLCVITVWRELPLLPAVPVFEMGEVAPEPALPAARPFPWKTLVGVLFVTGAAATCLHTLWSLVAVVRVIRRGRRERLDDGTILVRLPQRVTPFSWGRYIVISEEDLADNGAAILAHERAHVRLHHSVDLLVTDLAGCLQWFNPAMWLLRRELRAIHEYEADAAVLAGGVDAKSYQMLLIRKAVGGRWYSVANSFNHSKLKNRITMMLRKRSSRRTEARALLLLPLVGLALGAFAETRYVVPAAYKDTQNRITKNEMRAEIGPDTIIIRGTKATMDPAKTPMVIINGSKTDAKALDTLRPERIASVSVLKDSLSRATYGEEAKNGVIVVTLKKPGETAAASENNAYGTQVTTSPDGNTMSISISGSPSQASLSASGLEGNPMIVVDGERYSGSLNDLDVQQIRSMSIYKGNIPEKYRQYLGPENEGVIEIITKRAAQSAEKLRNYFQSDEWKQMQQKLAQSEKYFESEEWKRAQQSLEELGKLGQLGDLEQLNGTMSGFRTISPAHSATDGDDPSSPACNTVVGGRGGMVVTGPDVMSKTRSDDNGSVSVAKGRVTADFSEIEESEYQIEINGKPATKSDLERIEPGKIRRVELIRNDATPGKQGILRVRTRK
ncbi:MAG TPA: TonB-dependent receptor plug domain-containing protein [Candidatus Alistipes intestinigallinarum]|uniref:TonB-dependent receptor plug domain-containing protein n=1 Tax=Candidatus Alistipes intestinigallinarum TaxID=2838440 RepID=A0A9D1Z2E5_9BACT|nr:TonB-dependent receptor plug domain-containing protein [Candidatus Alistipes intestinigallinarum]